MYQQQSQNTSLKRTQLSAGFDQDDEGFNDRADATRGPTAGRAEFLAALRGTISETAAGHGTCALDGMQNGEDIDCLDPITGALTTAFREQLWLISEQQLTALDAVATGAAAPDLFGIFRRRCEACKTACSGYHPSRVVCPSSKSELDFPTFCQSCGCPACFHLIVDTGGALPRHMADSITSFNIRQQDINFNAVLAVFEIKDESTASRNVAALATLLRGEGLEVLSLEVRALDVEEALFLRSRQLAVQEQGLGEMVNQGFDGDKKRREEVIRGAGGAESAFSAACRNDLGNMDNIVRNQEQAIWKKAQRYLQGKTKSGKAQTQGKENSDLNNLMAEIPMRSNANQSFNSYAGGDGGPGLELNSSLELEQGLSASVAARTKLNRLRISTKAVAASQRFAAPKKSAPTSFATTKLMQTIQQSKQVSRMIGNRFLIVVVSSTSSSNLDIKLKNQIVPSFNKLAPHEEILCTYISHNRIHAIEDTVLFAPQLYRLQKSIILSEPTTGLFQPQLKHRPVSVSKETAYGEKYVDKDLWYKHMQEQADHISGLRSELAEVTVEEIGLRKGRTMRESLEVAEQKRSILASKRPVAAVIKTLDLGRARGGKDHIGLAAAMVGQAGPGRRRMTGLNKALTNSIRQRNFAVTEDFGVLKEGGRVEPDHSKGASDQLVQKPREDTQWTARDEGTNKMLRNYGTMLDFFDYSGMRVQDSKRLADLAQPPSFGFRLRSDRDQREAWDKQARHASKGMTNQCNLFAVAKVGTPNMIFPSTLDVQMRNYQDAEQYYQLSDLFFPENSKNQLTVVIIRPIIVSNGMNDLFVEILRANDFLIIKRKKRVLTKQEASYLCQLEKVGKDNIELYLDMLLDGPCEIVVLSKVGAVQDARTLCHGSETGRRRTSLIDEGTDGRRSNVDSLNAMFEIAPFSSFNEFVDLEDFLVAHSRLQKYQRDGLMDNNREGGQKIDALAVQKIEEIRLGLSQFTRHFSMAATAAPSEPEALKLMSLVVPRVAQLEELILILHPLYNDRLGAAEELLVRMQYRFVKTVAPVLNSEQVERLLEDKYGGDTPEGQKLMREWTNCEVHIYHLTKLAGEREVRALFAQSDAILEDYLFVSPVITEAKGALLPPCLPYLFLYMDSGTMSERAMELLYGKEKTTFTARDLLQKFKKNDLQSILETCLFTTAGDSILRVVYDQEGRLIPRSALKLTEEYQHGLWSGHGRPRQYALTSAGSVSSQGQREEAQFQLMLSQTAQDDSSVRYIVEGDSHGLFEIRFHKISHRGDASAASRFKIEDTKLDEATDSLGRPGGRRVRFDDAVSDEGENPLVQKEILYFFERFQTLNFYYQQVNKHLGGGVAPNFYRFKLCPQDGPELNRVYEVEEHMGRVFIEEVAEMQRAHARQLRHAKEARGSGADWQTSMATIDNQKSLPAFILGRQIALMCKKLEKVQCQDQSQLQGAGALVYVQKQQLLQGKVKNISQFYQADQARFSSMLTRMRARWFLYLSVLETEIIEAKLNFILESLTFKYTRQPELLSLIPDRLTEFNLRLASTVQVLNTSEADNEDGMWPRKKDGSNANSVNNKRKFYKDVYEDPDRAKDLSKVLDSVLHAINQPESLPKGKRSSNSGKKAEQSTQKASDQRKNGSSLLKEATIVNDQNMNSHFVPKDRGPTTYENDTASKREEIQQEENRGYSIQKHVAISGVEVAKRTKYQLIASVLYLVNFWLRKVNRRTELFADGKVDARQTEEQYDSVLDSIVKGIEENYGDDEINHVLDLVALRRGEDSKFEAVLREKMERQLKSQKLRKQLEQEKDRRRRNDPTIDFKELIKQETKDTADGDKSRFAQLHQFLAARRGVDKGFSGADGDQFMGLLDATKAKLGSNAVKLAEEFVLKAQLDAERKAAGRAGIQEKLSFVKTEYFLYGFSDASRLMEELHKFGLMIKEVEAHISACHQEELGLGKKLAQASIDMSGGANPYREKAQMQLKAENKAIKAKVQGLEREIDGIRFQMAQRETELLIVFRELMSWDIFAPEHYFDGDRLTKQDRWASDGANSDFLVPLTTFWRPIALDEPGMDPNSKEGREKYGLSGAAELEDPQARGAFLAAAIKAAMRGDVGRESTRSGPTAKDRSAYLPGSSMLRQPETAQERPANIVFHKLANPSFGREAEHLADLSQTLRQKTAPEREIRTNTDYVREANVDPFAHLRNKARSDELIAESIASYLVRGTELPSSEALTKEQCRELAQQAIRNMKSHDLRCEAFDHLNFETSYRIYAEDGGRAVAGSQLRNFLKSVAEI